MGIMVPNEYGHDEYSRTKIGATVCEKLFRKLLADLRNSVGEQVAEQQLPQMQIVTAVQYLKRFFGFQSEEEKTVTAPEDGSDEEDNFEEAELAGLDADK